MELRESINALTLKPLLIQGSLLYTKCVKTQVVQGVSSVLKKLVIGTGAIQIRTIIL